jgi:hypothetical protein
MQAGSAVGLPRHCLGQYGNFGLEGTAAADRRFATGGGRDQGFGAVLQHAVGGGAKGAVELDRFKCAGSAGAVVDDQRWARLAGGLEGIAQPQGIETSFLNEWYLD